MSTTFSFPQLCSAIQQSPGKEKIQKYLEETFEKSEEGRNFLVGGNVLQYSSKQSSGGPWIEELMNSWTRCVDIYGMNENRVLEAFQMTDKLSGCFALQIASRRQQCLTALLRHGERFLRSSSSSDILNQRNALTGETALFAATADAKRVCVKELLNFAHVHGLVWDLTIPRKVDSCNIIHFMSERGSSGCLEEVFKLLLLEDEEEEEEEGEGEGKAAATEEEKDEERATTAIRKALHEQKEKIFAAVNAIAGQKQNSVLHVAAEFGCARSVSILLGKRGRRARFTHTNAVNRVGNTILHCAVLGRDPKSIRQILFAQQPAARRDSFFYPLPPSEQQQQQQEQQLKKRHKMWKMFINETFYGAERFNSLGFNALHLAVLLGFKTTAVKVLLFPTEYDGGKDEGPSYEDAEDEEEEEEEEGGGGMGGKGKKDGDNEQVEKSLLGAGRGGGGGSSVRLGRRVWSEDHDDYEDENNPVDQLSPRDAKRIQRYGLMPSSSDEESDDDDDDNNNNNNDPSRPRHNILFGVNPNTGCSARISQLLPTSPFSSLQ